MDRSTTKLISDDLRVTALAGHLNTGRSGGLGLDIGVVIVVHDSVVGDMSKLGIGRSLAGEEERSEENVVPLQGIVLANHTLVNVRDEEEGGKNSQSDTGTNGNTSNPVSRLLGQTELRRTLVDDGQGADSAGNQEEEGRGVNSPRYRVASHVNGTLDKHEDGGTKDGRDEGGHDETGEDGTKTGAAWKICQLEPRLSRECPCTYRSIPIEHPLHRQ